MSRRFAAVAVTVNAVGIAGQIIWWNHTSPAWITAHAVMIGALAVARHHTAKA